MTDSSSATSRGRLLIVEDEKCICECLALVFSDSGFLVDKAYSAEEALKLFVTPPDLIMTDLLMPGMDGLEFLERIRDMGYNRATIVFTGYASEEVADRCYARGANWVLYKPRSANMLRSISRIWSEVGTSPSALPSTR